MSCLTVKVAFLVAITLGRRVGEHWWQICLMSYSMSHCIYVLNRLRVSPEPVNSLTCRFLFFISPPHSTCIWKSETSFHWAWQAIVFYLQRINPVRKSLRSSSILWGSLNGFQVVSHSMSSLIFIGCRLILHEHKQHQWHCFRKYLSLTFAKRLCRVPSTHLQDIML